ncbi:MAG: threonine synthase, partial [Candidatus Heimdallarchaeota archaeon]|nr:threonine synthase [Candidatus Heimdallarchaeota archaeon]
MSTLNLLQCTACDQTYDPNLIIRLCECGKVLFAKYDIEKAKETLVKSSFGTRKTNIWRMGEIMPCSSEFQFTLGEGWTPLLKYPGYNNANLMVKEEGLNPTGSFKARGLCAAISRGVELGLKEFVIPTAGNAGVAMAAYCAVTKSKAHIFTPKDVPTMILAEMMAYDADVTLVDGIISDASKMAEQKTSQHKWFDVSTLKEPYRAEGKKTLGLEIAEQLNWSLPDVVIYPTGGGTGIVGMMKAFEELEELGFTNSQRPRMVSVQAEGCAPIVKAFNEGKRTAEFWEDAATNVPGLRVPAAIGDYLILDAIYLTQGTALTITDE